MEDFEIKREDGIQPLKTGVSRSKQESWNVWGSTVKAGLNAFFFQPEDMFKICFNFNEAQPIYTCKCYACIKESVLLSEESFVTFHFLSV